MRQVLFIAAAAAALTLAATPSFAGRSEADACAARLPDNAKAVYAAAIDGVGPNVDLRELLRSRARGLVMAGKLSRSEARPAAEAAGECLRQAQ
jgi:hypothetical protein